MYTARDNQNRHDVRTIARRLPLFSGISTGEKSWLWVVMLVANETWDPADAGCRIRLGIGFGLCDINNTVNRIVGAG